MRVYQDKNNVQKKAYHSDRFRTAPSLARLDASEDESFFQTCKSLGDKVSIKQSYIELGQLVIWVEHQDNFKALELLKRDGYEVLSEMSAIDFIEQKNGFEIFYQLLSMKKHKRSRLKCFLPLGEELQSVESLYKSANWSEREMYDMFGIIVKNHPALKRLLMPDDWHGHPLLKSYPLHGDEEARWYEVDKIFGKEYREIIGEEQRDSAKVVEDDTRNFARKAHEVPYGMPKSEEKTAQEYQEDGGIAIVKRATKDKSKVIKGRR